MGRRAAPAGGPEGDAYARGPLTCWLTFLAVVMSSIQDDTDAVEELAGWERRLERLSIDQYRRIIALLVTALALFAEMVLGIRTTVWVLMADFRPMR